MIDLKAKIGECENFHWYEALSLPSWEVFVFPTKQEVIAIKIVALRMEQIRKYFGAKPIMIHSWLRPRKYNDYIGGAEESAHIHGMAVDFSILHMDCNEVRLALIKKLIEYNLRMEDLPDSNWVHIDIAMRTRSARRYFKP